MKAARAPSILELRRLARERLPRFVWEDIEGRDSHRLARQANGEALARVQFAPRILADAAQPILKTALLGLHYDSPLALVLPPAGELAGPDMERVLWRAARMANLPFVLPAHALRRLAQCRRECGCAPWLELHMASDHGVMRDILTSARQAGCEVLVLNAAPPPACSPPAPRMAAAADMLLHPRWLCGMAHVLARPRASAAASPPSRHGRPDWRDFIWLRTAWRGKLVLKGVLQPEDAGLAAQLGADGLIVCDGNGPPGTAAAVDMLPPIVAAAGKQLAILVEADMHGGMDVVKTLSLGADMVLAGRAILYGAAAGGQAGAERALQILHAEMERVLTLIGCASIAALGPAFLAGPSAVSRSMARSAELDELPPGVLRFEPKNGSTLSMRSPDSATNPRG